MRALCRAEAHFKKFRRLRMLPSFDIQGSIVAILKIIAEQIVLKTTELNTVINIIVQVKSFKLCF